MRQRIRTYLPWGFALAAALLACAKPAPKNAKKKSERPSSKIIGFEIEGNSRFTDQQIFDRIQSGPPPAWSLKRDPRFDEAAFRSDLDRIEALYQSVGYFDAKVVSYKVIPHSPSETKLLVVIEEGSPVEISSVRINFVGENRLPSDVEEYVTGADPKAPFPTRANLEGTLVHDRYLLAREELLSRMLERGFAQAKVKGEIKISRSDQTAEIIFTADPGPFSRFGAVSYEGLGRLSGSDLSRYQTFKKGEPFDSKKLASLQRNLYETGSFAAVTVEPLFAANQETVNIKVKLEEVQRHRVQFGGGAGIDATGRSDIHLRIGWLDRSFFGGLTRFQISGLAGVAFLDSGLAPLTNTSLSLSRPGFLRTSQSLTASLAGVVDSPSGGLLTATLSPRLGIDRDLLRERRARQERLNQQTELAPGAPELRALSFGYGYVFQLARLCFLSGDDNALCSPNGNLDDNALLALGLNGNQQTFQLGYLEQHFTYNKTDDPVDPRRGYSFSLSLHEGAGALALAPRGGFNYFRAQPEARAYVPLLRNRRLVWASRLQLGALLNLDALFGREPQLSPFPERFFLGGAGSHRGFGFQGLSPFEQFSDGSESVPVGGDGMALLSNEVRLDLPDLLSLISLPGSIRLSTFFDLGAVGAKVDDLFPLRLASGTEDAQGALRPALGGGIRYVYGPIIIRFDYARLLGERLAGEQPQKFHLSVGEAF